MGGESQPVLRYRDPDGRQIEVVSFGSYNPGTFLTAAHGGAATETARFVRCIDMSDGPTAIEQVAQASTSEERTVLGAQEWEYGGFLVTGSAGVTLEELIVVASGLRR